MKSAKSLYVALFAVSLLVAGNVTIRPRTTQKTGDQAEGDSITTTKSGKKNADSAATPKKNGSNSSTASTSAAAPVSKPPAAPSGTPGNTAPASRPTSAQRQTLPVKQRRRGLGQHGLRPVSQARDALVWQDETGQVHDRSRRAKGRPSRGGSGCTEKEIELAIYAWGLRRHPRF